MEFEKLKDIIVDVMGCNPDEITMELIVVVLYILLAIIFSSFGTNNNVCCY